MDTPVFICTIQFIRRIQIYIVASRSTGEENRENIIFAEQRDARVRIFFGDWIRQFFTCPIHFLFGVSSFIMETGSVSGEDGGIAFPPTITTPGSELSLVFGYANFLLALSIFICRIQFYNGKW